MSYSSLSSSSGMSVVMIVMFVALLLGLALPIAELVFADRYSSQDSRPNCANDRLIDPVKWLLVSGIVSIITIVASMVLMVITFVAESATAAVTALFVTILSGLFNIAWAIIGAVMLWRDNLHCDPEDLQGMLYASVILHLLSIFYSCCSAKTNVNIQ